MEFSATICSILIFHQVPFFTNTKKIIYKSVNTYINARKKSFFNACLTLREHVLIHFHTISRKDKRESYEMAPENINKENRI